MKKAVFFYSFVLISGLVSVCHAADCQKMMQDIKRERNFMTRKVLVEEAFAACPEDAVILFTYALSRERYNNPVAALKYYTKAALIDPKMAKAFFGMGDVYASLGKKNLARMAYTKGLTIDPTNVRAIRAKTALGPASKDKH